MGADYSAFNLEVWGLFWGFMVVVAVSVSWFRKRHPDYPCVYFQSAEDEK